MFVAQLSRAEEPKTETVIIEAATEVTVETADDDASENLMARRKEKSNG